MKRSFVAVLSLLALASFAFAQNDSVQNVLTDESKAAFVEEKSYSPYAGRSYPTRPLWGDTHLHTDASLDAFAAGARLGAEAAYRFARGEEVRMVSGKRVRLSRPLDWLVIADHSEFSGLAVELESGNPTLMADERNRLFIINGGHRGSLN